jgi:Cys-tRNA(Pro)/Cys-tRNA(Cys) deacylase
MKSNNITRLLSSRKIPFTAFELPAEKIGALETARLLGVEAGLIYKTIVLTPEKPAKPILAIIPGPHEVDLKAVAAVLGMKKVHLTTQREAEALTGLQAGGISPLALLKRGFAMILDDSAQSHAEIHISGGERGLNIRLPAAALIELTGARLAKISAPGASD